MVSICYDWKIFRSKLAIKSIKKIAFRLSFFVMGIQKLMFCLKMANVRIIISFVIFAYIILLLFTKIFMGLNHFVVSRVVHDNYEICRNEKKSQIFCFYCTRNVVKMYYYEFSSEILN